jgi:hypothetical protein
MTVALNASVGGLVLAATVTTTSALIPAIPTTDRTLR